MQNWIANKISDYWDDQVQAIDRFSRMLEHVAGPEQQQQLELVEKAVTLHVQQLPDEQLVKAAVVVSDDLYKAMTKTAYWDAALQNYLVASAWTFFDALRRRGYCVHYVVNNSYDDLTGPVRVFPLWYSQIGISYICPQHIAYKGLLQGREDDFAKPLDGDVSRSIAKNIAQACRTVDELIARCNQERRHFAFLSTDGDIAKFGTAIGAGGKPGIILVHRHEAPLPGTHCQIMLPTGPRSQA
jgi:hypothetical protein